MSRQITSVITHVTIPQNCAERRGLEPHSFRYAPAFETGCNTCMRDSPCVLRAFRRDRTADLSLFRGALYRLSYKGIWCGTWLRYDHISRLSRCPTCVDSRAACARPATRSSRLRPWTSPTVPAVGVEPTCPFGHRGLSSARMPFRQAGILTSTPPRTRTGNLRNLNPTPLPIGLEGHAVWWRKVVNQTTDARSSHRRSFDSSTEPGFHRVPRYGCAPRPAVSVATSCELPRRSPEGCRTPDFWLRTRDVTVTPRDHIFRCLTAFHGCQVVGVTGFEPATSCSQSKRATKLRHTPLSPLQHQAASDNVP